MSSRFKRRQHHGAELLSSSASIAGQHCSTSHGPAPLLNQWYSLALCTFLILSVWVVFGQCIHFGFVNYDDDVCVYENPAISPGINRAGIGWVFTHFNNAEWLPLTSLSHMLDCQVFGLNAGGHHFTNVLLHATTAVLLFLLLRQLTGAFWCSAFVAALFALHPLRVESVAWVTERKDVLSGLFFVLALSAYARYARERFKATRYLLVILLFSFALLSKAMVVTLPFVLLLLDYWPLERWRVGAPARKDLESPRKDASPSPARFWPLIIEKVPLLVLAAVASVITVLAARSVQSIAAAQGLTMAYRIGNALVAYVDYLGHMLYPMGLSVGYSNPVQPLPVLKVAWSVLVLSGISTMAVVWRRKYPFLLMGWLWYLGMLVPVIDVMQSGEQARADRYTYLPQIGLYIMAAWGAAELGRSWRHKQLILGTAAVAILGCLITASRIQTQYWQDSGSLWTHSLACNPANAIAHCNFGAALVGQGKMDEAIAHLERALQLNPNYGEAHNNLGFVLLARGRLAEAVQHCTEALQLKPDLARAHLNLGIALAAQGHVPQAIEHYHRALELDPRSSDAELHLGLALAAQGQFAPAIEHYQRAIQLKPDSSEAQAGLGLALARQGKPAQAIAHLSRSLQLNPNSSIAHNNLGVVLASQGKIEEAIQHFERALELRPENHEARTNLDRALAAQTTSGNVSPVSKNP